MGSLYVTYGIRAGSAQLQTRTRTGSVYQQRQTRTRTVTAGSTTERQRRDGTLQNVSSSSFCSCTTYGSAEFVSSCNPVTINSGICSGEPTTICGSTVLRQRSRFCPYVAAKGETCTFVFNRDFAFACDTTFTPCSAGALIYEDVGTACREYIGVITPATPANCDVCGNYGSYSTVGSCSSNTTCTTSGRTEYDCGSFQSRQTRTCSVSTTPASCNVIWGSWYADPSCTSGTSTCSANGQQYTTTECRNISIPTCSPGTFSGWTNVSSCTIQYGTDGCSGTIRTDCRTIDVCEFGSWTDWTNTDICNVATPACSNGAVQRECREI
jgi:hypothetical protein